MSADELVAGVVAIHDGREPDASVRDPQGGADAREQSALTWPGQSLGLTQRESEMLTFIVRGLTNDEIARRSFLSVNTVKTYIRTAYRKIGVQSRAQAVGWGYRHGFRSTDDTGV